MVTSSYGGAVRSRWMRNAPAPSVARIRDAGSRCSTERLPPPPPPPLIAAIEDGVGEKEAAGAGAA
uniref:Uncharacterized protein n=1 Tax=Oryza sativa subsp. japonica TaxID=39947 RepID=Q654A1_ORYSJ|nr:hypothetical protein [Oryza sativa Japonica Group]